MLNCRCSTELRTYLKLGHLQLITPHKIEGKMERKDNLPVLLSME